MTPRRILVCGGRDLADRALVYATLDRLDAESRIGTLIARGWGGADLLARRWAVYRERRIESFHADRDGYGAAAAPMRDRRMLKEGAPDLVVAFPGTADMTARARAAGVAVEEIG